MNEAFFLPLRLSVRHISYRFATIEEINIRPSVIVGIDENKIWSPRERIELCKMSKPIGTIGFAELLKFFFLHVNLLFSVSFSFNFPLAHSSDITLPYARLTTSPASLIDCHFPPSPSLFQDVDLSQFPLSATTLHFEFYAETPKAGPDTSASSSTTTPSKSSTKHQHPHHHSQQPNASVLQSIHLEHVDQQAAGQLPSQLMEEVTAGCAVPIPKEKLDLLFTHLRLAFCFATTQTRIQCVQARLQALSILVYSNSLLDNSNAILYNGLIEELVDILELKATPTTGCARSTSLSAALKRKKSAGSAPGVTNGAAGEEGTTAATGGVVAAGNYPQVLTEIKAAALRTLTSIIHLDRNPKMTLIIDATGASSYHGFLPVLVRSCIQVGGSGEKLFSQNGIVVVSGKRN